MITSFEALVYRNMRNKTNLFCSTEILWFWLGFLKFSLFVYLFCCCLLELFGFWGSLGFFGGGGEVVFLLVWAGLSYPQTYTVWESAIPSFSYSFRSQWFWDISVRISIFFFSLDYHWDLSCAIALAVEIEQMSNYNWIFLLTASKITYLNDWIDSFQLQVFVLSLKKWRHNNQMNIGRTKWQR